MALVKSRFNGLILTIPADARGIISNHFMSSGDNELIFDPSAPKNPGTAKSRARLKTNTVKAASTMTVESEEPDQAKQKFEDLD